MRERKGQGGKQMDEGLLWGREWDWIGPPSRLAVGIFIAKFRRAVKVIR